MCLQGRLLLYFGNTDALPPTSKLGFHMSTHAVMSSQSVAIIGKEIVNESFKETKEYIS